jgi:hypothetical protein
MSQKYLRGIFPEIKEWKDNKDDLRLKQDINSMPFKYWFFFHYTAYSIIMFSYYILNMIIFFGISFSIFYISNTFLNFFGVVFSIFGFYFIYKFSNWTKIYFHNYRLGLRTNMYDILLREYG